MRTIILILVMAAGSFVVSAVAQTIHVIAVCGTATLSAGSIVNYLYMDTSGRVCVRDVPSPSPCNGAVFLGGCVQPMLGVM